jgi:hypothetical protein
MALCVYQLMEAAEMGVFGGGGGVNVSVRGGGFLCVCTIHFQRVLNDL